MGLFGRKKSAVKLPDFPPEEYEPVLRCSICTGEQVGCMRSRSTGKLSEVMLIRTADDLKEFCAFCHTDAQDLRKVY
ncbi:MAG: aspartate dehydrogenase [Oscillospiraceae bacterium]|nr:aspartate dehydrogenase [Oscillospiraceae bacterium]